MWAEFTSVWAEFTIICAELTVMWAESSVSTWVVWVPYSLLWLLLASRIMAVRGGDFELAS